MSDEDDINMMDWDDPVARFHLVERIGIAAYNEALAKHKRDSVIETVNGHAIRAIYSERLGRIYVIDDLGRGHETLEGARKIAREAAETSSDREHWNDIVYRDGDSDVARKALPRRTLDAINAALRPHREKLVWDRIIIHQDGNEVGRTEGWHLRSLPEDDAVATTVTYRSNVDPLALARRLGVTFD
jgi:hypothetical protein